MLTIHNLTDGDTVHQRCLLLVGQSDAPNAEATDRVALSTTDNFGRSTFPIQQWPMCHGHFKVLVVLSPGTNRIIISHNPRVATVGSPAVVVHIVINYVPLLQVPPLHLAILVAKDSPLQIDCPPAKHGALSSAHSSLEAAISKFRMTAYMWQALTAEDMRRKGLGRRSFRLEEEWGFDSLSSEFLNIKNDGAAFDDAMRSTAKVHLVRTERTVAELRDLQRAQQNPHGRQRDELHDIFSKALKASGGVFESAAKPVVAGLILDAHFSADHDMILAHAALGAHNANGLSLGVMGSHLTYAWPRFLEEVPDCLLDTTAPGEMVGNDNKECESIWEACAVGQGAFLHETGHAFSAPHTSGIMARGYSQHWPKCFLAQTAYCVAKKTEAITPVTEDTANECTWDVRDALRFKNLPHFRLPSDMPVEPKANSAVPEVQLLDDEDFLRVQITSQSGLAGVWLNGKPQPNASIKNPVESLRYTLDELEERFDRTKPLELELLAMNGKCRTCNMWRLFTDKSTVRVPGTSIRLQKASVGSQEGGEPGSTKNEWSWAVMLKKRTKSGKLIPASKIDLRVGCLLDGAVVHYKDGSTMPCGPRWDSNGNESHMGGHQARKIALRRDGEITKVQVAQGGSWGGALDGLRMHLSTGKAMGALNSRSGREVKSLRPPPKYFIVGFYGTSGSSGYCSEFGIISAPKNVELPDSMYDLPELQNTDGGTGTRGRKGHRQREEFDDDHDTETSQDEDEGYDDNDFDDDNSDEEVTQA